MINSRAVALLLVIASVSMPSVQAADPVSEPAAFERILLPVMTPPVRGAHGSEFHSLLTVVNKSMSREIDLFGLRPRCDVHCFPPIDLLSNPIILYPEFNQIEPRDVVPEGSPGRFLFVRRDEVSDLAINLRVADVSRDVRNFGTEMPVVRESNFVEGDLALAGVPFQARFRNTLRIYATQPTTVTIFLFGPLPPGSPMPTWPNGETITLRAGANIFEPAYATTTRFPTVTAPNGIGNVLITQTPEKFVCPECPITRPIVPVWAFMSITDNETQEITLVHPQP